MAKRKVDPNVKAQLASSGGAVVTTENLELPGGDVSYPYAWYHQANGREHWLPTDPWNVEKFTKRGFLQGKASSKLRAKWKRGEAKRDAAYDETVAAFAKANPPETDDRIAKLEEKIEQLTKLLLPD